MQRLNDPGDLTMNHRTLVFYFNQRILIKDWQIILNSISSLDLYFYIYGSGKSHLFHRHLFLDFQGRSYLYRSCTLSFTLIATQMQQHFILL